MGDELQENKKQLMDKRKEFENYLYSISKSQSEVKLADEIGIDRNFLRRVLGKENTTKQWVENKSAFPLCKFIASHQGKTVKEVLEIL